MAKQITLQIGTLDEDGQVTFRSIGGVYDSRIQAMYHAKKFAGCGAHYWGDELSIRYAGPNGTVYLCEKSL